MQKERDDAMMAALAPSIGVNDQITFDFTKVRYSAATLAAETEVITEKHLKVMRSMSEKIDKMLVNSLFGKMPQQFIVRVPLYSAEKHELEGSDLPHRVRIRCTNYGDIGPRFPSEDHACEGFVRDDVLPWAKANAAGRFVQINYSVVGFADETDATLCLMRFK